MTRSDASSPLRERLRQRLGSLAFDHGLRGLAYLGSLHPNARPERHQLEVVRDLAYLPTGSPDHRLDVYRPRWSAAERPPYAVHTPPFPVVLYIHGGSFRILSKDTHWMMGLAFARRGYLVFNINYRLAPQHPFPAALQDAGAALAYVLAEAERLGGDPRRLVLAGESAGANLAMALALLTCQRHREPWAARVFDLGAVPKVVAPMCGMLQVSDSARFARRKPLRQWVQDRLHEVTKDYLDGAAADAPRDLADPLLLLERDEAMTRPLPAFFAGVGTRDPLLDDTRRLGQALARRQVPHAVRYYPGELHAFHALVHRAQAQQCWRDLYAFLDEHLAA